MAMMQPPAEQLATRQDVQAVDAKVDRLREDVQAVDAKVDRLREDVHQLDKKVDGMDGMLQVMREHMASKGDVERMGRVLTFWMVGAISALIGIVLTVVTNLTNAVLQLAR